VDPRTRRTNRIPVSQTGRTRSLSRPAATASSSAKSVLFNRRVAAAAAFVHSTGAYGKLPVGRHQSTRRATYALPANRVVDIEEPGHDSTSRSRSSSLAASEALCSTMAGDPWGGSEELWSRAALHLAAEGCLSASAAAQARACVGRGWGRSTGSALRSTQLSASGEQVRPSRHTLWKQAWSQAALKHN
jgi:hypothetical protein